MFTSFPTGANAPTVPPTQKTTTYAEPVRIMMFGSASAVRTAIKDIHKHGYADPNDWSKPIATERADEVMSILTKRVSLE